MASKNNQGFQPALEALEDRLSLTSGITLRMPVIARIPSRPLVPPPPLAGYAPNQRPAVIFNPVHPGPGLTIGLFNPTTASAGIPIPGLTTTVSSQPPSHPAGNTLTVIYM